MVRGGGVFPWKLNRVKTGYEERVGWERLGNLVIIVTYVNPCMSTCMSTRDDNPHHDIFRYEFDKLESDHAWQSKLLYSPPCHSIFAVLTVIFAVMTGNTVITANIRGNDSTVLSVQRIFAVMTEYTVIMANIRGNDRNYCHYGEYSR